MSSRRAAVIGGVLTLALVLLLAGAAAAFPVAIQPPQASLSFSPSGIQPNGTSVMTVTLANPNGSSLTGVGFTDTLPDNVVVDSTPAVTNACAGTVTATAGSGTVSLSGGTIGASSSCTITVSVTSADTGVYVDSTGPVTANESGTASTSASATLNVANPPTITAGFSPDTVPQGANSGLYFTIQNPNSNSTPPNSDVTLHNVSFSDTLPAGMVVASPNGASSDCGGTLTAVPGSSTIQFSGGTIDPAQPPDFTGGACNVLVEVTATQQGQLSNTTGPVSADESGPGAASNSATLSVGAPALPPTATIAFADSSIPLGASSVLTLNLSNPNQGASLDNVTLDDPLPAGLRVAATPGVGGTCVSAQGAQVSAAPGGDDVSTSGFALPAGESCTVTVALTGTAAGNQVDTTRAPTATYDDGNSLDPVTGNQATAFITVVAPVQAAATFGTSHIPTGSGTSYTITLTNPNSGTALSGIGLTVTLSAGLTFTGPPGSCAGTAVATGAGSLTLTGAALAAGASCTISGSVSAGSDGVKAATMSPVSSAEGGAGAPANAVLLVASPPTAAISFAPASTSFGRAVRLWLTVRNPNHAVALSGVALADGLPSGTRLANPSRVLGYCGRGVITANPGGTNIVLNDGTIPAGGYCTFSALLHVSGSGTFTDRTGAPSAAVVGSGAPAQGAFRIGPSNHFSITGVTALSGGRFRVTLALPGPGRIEALLSAPTASRASLQPGRRQLTYAGASANVHRGGTASLLLVPGTSGLRLLSHHHGTLRLTLQVAFTPTGGSRRTLRQGGLQPHS